MWDCVAAAAAAAIAAISAYAANGGISQPKEADPDWLAYERERTETMRREAAAIRRMALLGAVLMVALAASVLYMAFSLA